MEAKSTHPLASAVVSIHCGCIAEFEGTLPDVCVVSHIGHLLALLFTLSLWLVVNVLFIILISERRFLSPSISLFDFCLLSTCCLSVWQVKKVDVMEGIGMQGWVAVDDDWKHVAVGNERLFKVRASATIFFDILYI